ncbi:M14 family metallopeptidase [Streptomyces gobiensis]|uniref:M14 family metallopeptidase n=1 Tax=Streptomyces gobiensis TaxID=2875706 RepID=UPI001E3ECC08|nr:M14 family metallopeptidase [Streptomyces gobiensis]UGY93877.1 M14 family metallopeptidase [Streptomyces gobiensis]
MRLRIRGKRTTSAAVLLTLALAVPLGAQATAAPPKEPATTAEQAERQDGPRQYEVAGVGSRAHRSALARTGVAIDEVRDHSVVITATPAQADRLRKLGHRLTALPGPGERGDIRAAGPADYHSYAQMMDAVNTYVQKYPELMSRQVIGKSYQGRDIIAVKISSNVRVDEDKPEVLFTHNMHAREHLTTEMALYTLREFAAQYGKDARITKMLDERELWIIPTQNPDGKVYDMQSGRFRMWRKNRQPNSGTSAVGTDINRNFDYRWGCCGGSSGSPSSQTYRGPSAESGTETKVVADFVRSRVVGGKQQITAHIDFHTYGELILWPYGYTYADTAPGLTRDDRDAHAAVGTSMARSNGYKPQQSSDLYITDGSIGDWMWGAQRIFSYTFEMYPPSGHPDGFYPPGRVIGRETARNKGAMLILLENADCMYRSIGKEAEYCQR